MTGDGEQDRVGSFVRAIETIWLKKAESIISKETTVGPETEKLFIALGAGLVEVAEDRVKSLESQLAKVKRQP